MSFPARTDSMLKEGTFQDKTIVITGGGTGLGRSMGETLLGLGANLVICGRRSDVIEAAAAEMQQETGGTVLAKPATCGIRNKSKN